jgi:hypothetical protein
MDKEALKRRFDTNNSRWFVTRPQHAKSCDMGLYHDMTCKYQGLTRTGYLWGGGRPVNKTLSVAALVLTGGKSIPFVIL